MSLSIRARRAEGGAHASPVYVLFLLLAGLALALAGCNSSSTQTPSTEGYSSTVALTTPIAPGTQCPAGGYQIDYGIDVNQNGTLDPGEVEGTAVVCNGAAGSAGVSALVTTTPLAAGEGGCAAGGYRLDFGLDANGNGTLDSTEILSTSTVCNGVDGLPGSSGSDGANALITSQTADPDGTCPAGGVVFSYGLDNGPGTEANNGVLDADEVLGTREVCNGQSPLVVMTPVAPGAAGSLCGDYGGTRIDIGFDNGAGGTTAGDGQLDGDELVQQYYLCDRGAGISESNVGLTLLVTHQGTVAATGTSSYTFHTYGTTDVGRLDYRIHLSGTDSDLTVTAYRTSDQSQVQSCDVAPGVATDEWCDLGVLDPDTDYNLTVAENGNVPNVFQIEWLDNPTVIAADSSGYFYDVDPSSGEVTALNEDVGDVLGPTDLRFVVGDPNTGLLYGMTGSEGMIGGQPAADTFFRIDPYTGASVAVTLYESDGSTPFTNADILGMAVDPVTGTLYAGVPTGHGGDFPWVALYTVALTTDAGGDESGTLTAYSGGGLVYPDFDDTTETFRGMVFDGSGVLYMVTRYDNEGTTLYPIDLSLNAEGASTALTTDDLIDAAGPPLLSLAVRPSDGRIVGSATGDNLFDLDACSSTSVLQAPFSIRGALLLANLGLSAPTPPQPCVWVNSTGSDFLELMVQSYPMAQQLNLYWSDAPGIDPADPRTYRGRQLDFTNGSEPDGIDYYSDVSGLLSGTTYYVVVTAVVNGEEVPSSEVSGTTQ